MWAPAPSLGSQGCVLEMQTLSPDRNLHPRILGSDLRGVAPWHFSVADGPIAQMRTLSPDGESLVQDHGAGQQLGQDSAQI